jgi:hypothetical protein
MRLGFPFLSIALATQFFDALHVREGRDERVARLPYTRERFVPDGVGGGAGLFRPVSHPFRGGTRFFGVGALLLGLMASGFGGQASLLGPSA